MAIILFLLILFGSGSSNMSGQSSRGSRIPGNRSRATQAANSVQSILDAVNSARISDAETDLDIQKLDEELNQSRRNSRSDSLTDAAKLRADLQSLEEKREKRAIAHDAAVAAAHNARVDSLARLAEAQGRRNQAELNAVGGVIDGTADLATSAIDAFRRIRSRFPNTSPPSVRRKGLPIKFGR